MFEAQALLDFMFEGDEWSPFESNLFSADHRAAMQRNHGFTMAESLTVSEMQEEYARRVNVR